MSDPVLTLTALVTGVALLVLTLYAIFMLMTAPHRRRIAGHMVMTNLVAIVRQDLPLATGLLVAADGETERVGRTLTRIAGFLSNGMPLSQALRMGYPGFPALASSLIAAGERSGRLSDAVQQAHQILLDQEDRKRRLDPTIGPYALIVLSSMCFIFAFVMILIIPKFEEIFRDFDSETPALLATVIGVSRFFASGPILPLIALLLVMAVIGGFYLRLRPRRTPVPYRLSRIADAARWYTPLFRGMHRGAAMSAIFGIMRSALRSGIGLPDAARLASSVDVNWYARKRMAHFADLLSRGTNVGRAAGEAHLGGLVASTLESGQRSGDFDAALRYLGDYYASLVSRWWLVCQNLAWPVFTLVLGTVVGIVVLSLFTPLVSLIHAVCDSTGL